MGTQMRVGLVGCGRWGRYILRDLRQIGCEVAVVARSEGSRATAVAGGAEVVVGTIAALPPVAGIVVATPTATHGAVLEACLEREVPIFVEKPMTADPAQALRLAAQAPDRIFVMDKWRYHPGVELLAEIARSGELGAVLGLRTTRAQWGSPHHDVDGIWILLPHDLSIALEILGEVPAARSAMAEQRDGVATSLFGVLGDAPWLVVEVSTRFPDYRREIRLHCQDGVAVLNDGYSVHVAITRHAAGSEFAAPPAELRPISDAMPLLRELEAFVEHLRGGPPPRSSAAEGALIVSRIGELRALAGLP